LKVVYGGQSLTHKRPHHKRSNDFD